MRRYMYQIPRKFFATKDGIRSLKKGKFLHNMFMSANSEEQALKRIRKTEDAFIFKGEVNENNVLIKRMNNNDKEPIRNKVN